MISSTPSANDRTGRRLAYFLMWNLVALAGTAAIFALVLVGDFATGPFAAAWGFFRRHETLLALAASTPFLASLLVGWASSKRARARRAHEARARAAEELRAAQGGPTAAPPGPAR